MDIYLAVSGVVHLHSSDAERNGIVIFFLKKSKIHHRVNRISKVMKFTSVLFLSVCLVAMAVEAMCKYCSRICCVIQILIPNLLLFLVVLLHENILIS
jgi:hypothetical protein